ncbi:hypothetical protein QBC32DRAFT_351608 [Pseudoneurospora amorphoporcata]|uniref:Uncharacterized protein n=1 Tax=Pseudoneurospora amorphoporcata TaxID=241081 RepID=A0AAN6SCC7_9PEZI|nr:hypothetical protein QBC32DRAFT_351608 [Pseudoneurospora amorphoporcata]
MGGVCRKSTCWRYLLLKQAPRVVLDRGRLALDDLTAGLPKAEPKQWEAVGDAKGRGARMQGQLSRLWTWVGL